VCYGTSTPPILQCGQGHVVCSTCLPRITSCPVCRGSVTCRNLALEALCEGHQFPCPHSTHGCTRQLELRDLRY
ncbi:seven in absentia, partial [Tribonema minus]